MDIHPGLRDVAASRPWRDTERLADGLLAPDVAPELRYRLGSALATLSPRLLGALRKNGITVTVRPLDKERGHFNVETRQVVIDQNTVDQDDFKRVMLHEVGHALDFISREQRPPQTLARRLLGHPYPSEMSDEVRAAYRDFRARSAIAQAALLKFMVCKENDVAPGQPYAITQKRPMGDGTVCVHLERSANGVEVVRWRRLRPALETLRTAAALAGNIVGMGPSAMLGLALLLPQARREKPPALQLEHADDQGAVERTRMTVRSPWTEVTFSGPHSPLPAVSWSQHHEYIADSESCAEYVADGVAAYLDSPERRARLQEQEPALYRYVEKLVEDVERSNP